jgi:ribonuclease-3
MKIDYFNLEKKINYKFKDKNFLKKSIKSNRFMPLPKCKDKKLLVKSLTHKSYDKINNNEKIEFLGDRVLGLIIAKKLLEIYPDEKEGILDKKFASLVNKKTCLQIANNISLEKYILTFNPKNKKIKVEDKVIADCCEALIGAIYLDKGFTAVENFILTFWSKNIKESVITQIDAKTKLQEYSLKKFKKLPTYKIISNTGPRHKPIFKVAVKLPNTKFYIGQGTSKKDAEQNAAIICLENNQ